jgi:hypothetical protein
MARRNAFATPAKVCERGSAEPMSTVLLDEAKSGWLDNVIEDLMKNPNARIRANAVIALTALGGPSRMALLARLIGEEGLRAKAGGQDAGEVFQAATRAINAKDFSEEDRKHLKLELTRKVEGLDARRQAAARAILQADDGTFLGARRMGRIAARGRIFKSLLLAIPVILISYAALWSVVLIVGFAGLILSYEPNFIDDFKYLLALFPSAAVAALVGGMVAIPASRRLVPLMVDAVLSGVPAALAGGCLLSIPWLAASDSDLTAGAEWARVAAVFLAMAAPGFVAVRMGLAHVPREAGLRDAILMSVQWPSIVATVAAIGAQWSVPNYAFAASTAWVAFVMAAAAFALAVRRVDEQFGELALPSGEPSPLQMWPVVVVPALLLATGTISYLSYAPAQRNAVADDPEMLLRPPFDEQQRSNLIFSVPVPARVVLTAWAPQGTEIFVNRQSLTKRSDESYPGDGSNPPSASPYPTSSFLEDFGQPRIAAVGTLMLCVRQQPQAYAPAPASPRTCGVKGDGPRSWLAWLTGRAREPMFLDKTQQTQETNTLHLVASAPSPVDLGEVTAEHPWSKTVVPRAGQVFDFSVIGASVKTPLRLNAELADDEVIRDRILIVERIEERDSGAIELYSTIAASRALDRKIEFKIERPGRYRLCARLYNASFVNCETLAHELLPDRINVSFSPAID